MTKIKVLIAGAGPVGLAAALFLSSNPNVEIEIIEKKTEQNSKNQSRALVINPRTISLFTGYPIQKRLIEESMKCDSMKMASQKKVLIEINLHEKLKKKTKYSHMYMYPQTYTEIMLEEEINKLGIKVKRGVQITEIRNVGNNVITKFKGDKQKHIYDYVLGADGARSMIRKQLGFKFQGETLNQKMYFYDFQNEGEQLKAPFTVVGNPKIFGAIPVKDKIIRVISNTPDYHELVPSWIKIDRKKPIWQSSFKLNNRYVDRMSSGRVFLAGDAAHVHIPAGGRGMNLGIEDVFVFSHLLREGKLQKYSELRMPIISNFVDKLKKIAKFMVLQKSILRSFGSLLAPLMGRIVEDNNVLFITGLDHDIPYLPKL